MPIRVQAEDNDRFDIIGKVLFCGAMHCIREGLKQGGVLVNCWGGVNRSATVAIAFMVLEKDVDLCSALEGTMATRGTVSAPHRFLPLAGCFKHCQAYQPVLPTTARANRACSQRLTTAFVLHVASLVVICLQTY
jgi:hypothetical protein